MSSRSEKMSMKIMSREIEKEDKMRAKVFLILFVGILIGGGATYIFLPKGYETQGPAQEENKQLYSCGMHPEVISDKPGNCPICAMKLTPIRDKGGDPGQPRSGEKRKEREILYWRAPMDPTEIYDKPGKSKMGMDLVPLYEGEEAGGAGSILIDGTIQQNMNLRTAPVERRNIESVIRAFGNVTYAQDEEYSVSTKITGWIEKLYVNTEGQRVKKGETLLEIYSPELVSTQEEYLLALDSLKKLGRSPYESIRKNAERMLRLARNRLEYWDISETEINKIEQTREVRRTILWKSQVSGIVTHKAVVEGDRVGPGKDLFHIANLDKIWVEAAVYESELPLVRRGQKAELELDQMRGKTFEGKVDFIYPYLDQKSRANNVRLVFSNTNLELKPDMFATVRIFAPVAADSHAIPAEAVIYSGKRQIVFVSRGDGKFEPREVKTGVESGEGYIQVLSGLFDGEQVVVSGQFLLDSESRTREAIAKMRAAQSQRMETGSKAEKTSEEHSHPEEEHQTMEQEAKQKERLMDMKAADVKKADVLKKGDRIDRDPSRFYACPMHPEFITTNPEARCPECGMQVVQLKELEEKVDLDKAVFYTCPMHPDFLTTDPDGRCPECGMKLEKAGKIRK
jgi:Cu(I)/Ag(I) efflux system membrane fusion protein